MEPDELIVPAIETAGEPPKEGSLLDRLVAAREEAAGVTTCDIKLPGYGNADISLYVRYRLLDAKEIETIQNKATREFKNQRERNMYGGIDVFIAACEGFYWDDGDGRNPLTYNGEHITGYNQLLAEALKLKVDPNHPARSIVMAMFMNNEVALGSHNMKLSLWMADTSIDADKALLGNL